MVDRSRSLRNCSTSARSEPGIMRYIQTVHARCPEALRWGGVRPTDPRSILGVWRDEECLKNDSWNYGGKSSALSPAWPIMPCRAREGCDASETDSLTRVIQSYDGACPTEVDFLLPK